MYFVRTACVRDLDKVRELLIDAWHTTYDSLIGANRVDELIGLRLTPAVLKARLELQDSEFVIADNGREIGGVGYAVMSEDVSKTVVLQLLYVRHGLQRRGIGRDIFAELETCFPEADTMRIEVDAGIAALVAFYEAHGFHVVDRLENDQPGQSGRPALIMEKPLAGN
jgi:ribosomal protein S18 acetylase RimI-like enzyme